MVGSHAKQRSIKRFVQKPSLSSAGIYVGIFAVVTAFVASGYQPPAQVDGNVASVAATAGNKSPAANQTPSVDEVLATNIAAKLAENANLAVTPNVAELSTSLAVISELSQSDASIVSKPQIVDAEANSRDIVSYTVSSGDTVDSIAAQHGVNADTVRWANNIAANDVDAGKQLTIPPVNGVVYSAKAGDTVAALASRYSADESRIVSFNDLELNRELSDGQRLVIPNGVMPEQDRPGYVAPRIPTRATSTGGSAFGVTTNRALASAGNAYAPGNCTWYVYERRAAAGRPIGSFWGNASTWGISARSAGFNVNQTPAVGSIMQNGGGFNGWGHVAYVESIAANGDVTVMEMNYAGYNVISSRTIPAAQVGSYNFIH